MALYGRALDTSPASNPAELTSSLRLVRATVLEGQARTFGHIIRYVPRQASIARRSIKENRGNLERGDRLATLALDALLREPDAEERIVDPLRDYPALLRWLHYEYENSGATQRAIAHRMGVPVSEISSVLNNSNPAVQRRIVIGMARALAAKSGLRGDDREAYIATAEKLHREYEQAGSTRGMHQVPPTDHQELPPPCTTQDELNPVIGTVGATILHGLERASDYVDSLSSIRRQRAQATLEGHYEDLYSYLRLARLSIGVILGDPRAAERLLDPIYDLPEFLRFLRQELRDMKIPVMDAAAQLGKNSSATSVSLNDRGGVMRPRTAKAWAEYLAHMRDLGGADHAQYVATVMDKYRAYCEVKRALPSGG